MAERHVCVSWADQSKRRLECVYVPERALHSAAREYGYVPASELDAILSASFELLEWADNWMPDEANDQGAREARNNLRRLLEVTRG